MSNKKAKKKKFRVEEGQTISDVLETMRVEGYTPVARFEKPVFIERSKKIEVSHQEIIFEGKLIEE
ncbi:NETI motif-containing protein [Phocicoccus pinnipedialis]|uniref:NETI motif-containing protein n=1 Tax=Phocicoccus pinnipedialis TaxID=110845 RepID=A0A6V7RAM3_9BACL|nr:NETI motif-containing protein [Jeotgalicoccus pinnipedialis]MBP1940206.1 hypothetical protein [Jeotgalicoccus pinnipedialis]CAD2074014.1 hypothetical protein JEOPIN946_00786 [Jeotgalicoccus pinnipedialis]